MARYLQPHLPGSGRILDWGAGIGRIARHVALANPRATVHCVDLSADMISLGRRRCGGVGNIAWHEWTGRPLPIPQVEFAYSFLTFQHNPLEGTRRAIAEIARLLDGRALLEFPTAATDDFGVHTEQAVGTLLQKHFDILDVRTVIIDVARIIREVEDVADASDQIAYRHYLVRSR